MSGILWFSLLIPFILIGILLSIPKLRKMTKWWELAIPIVITVITVVICQWIAINSATKDKEYWGHMSYSATHEEPFTYDGECSTSYSCNCTTDSKGNQSCSTCTDYYRCDRSSSRNCFITDDRGMKYRISYGKYKELDKRWKHNQYKVKTIITKKRADGILYTTVGDKFKRPGHGNRHIVKWDKIPLSSEPIVKEFTYENKLQTQSHWGKITDEEKLEFDVFDYPSVPAGWRLQSLLTNGPAFRKADQHLQYLNGHLNTNKGGYKKVRLWVLVYNKQPQASAELQRAYWKGGNKNELVIMLGMNESREITWADIMSQADASDTLMIQIRDQILLEMVGKKNGYSGQLTDAELLKFVQWLGPAVKAGYTKPDFKQYDYIQVTPSPFAIAISYLIIAVVNIAAGFFVVYNPWYEGNRPTRRTRRSRGNYRFH